MTDYRTVVILAAALCAPALAQAQDASNYPERQVRVVVGSSPGGTADTVSRLLAQALEAEFGQSFFVDNLAGAGGALAATNVANAEPDGYTIQFIFSSHAILPSLNSAVSYDPVADFAPISLVSYSPNILVANPEFGGSTIAELAEKLRASPGQIDFGSGGIGYSQHLSMELFLQGVGAEAVHIPYAGSGQLIAALLANEVPFAFEALTAVAPHIESGALVPLGVTAAERSPILPDVPTIGETIEGFEVLAWNGFVAPAGTPAPIVEKLNAAIGGYLNSEDAAAFFERLGTTPAASTPEEFGALIQSDFETFGELIRSANISID